MLAHHPAAIPNFKTIELILPLREQQTAFCDCLVVGQPGHFLNGLNATASHQVASHRQRIPKSSEWVMVAQHESMLRQMTQAGRRWRP